MYFREWFNATQKQRTCTEEGLLELGWNAALENQWQPIETAPKDGRAILLYNGRIITQGYYNSDGKAMYSDQPTHWMSLPKPPQKENQ